MFFIIGLQEREIQMKKEKTKTIKENIQSGFGSFFYYITSIAFLIYYPNFPWLAKVLTSPLWLASHIYKIYFYIEVFLVASSLLFTGAVSAYQFIEKQKNTKQTKQNEKEQELQEVKTYDIVKDIPYQEVTKNLNPGEDALEKLKRERENLNCMKEMHQEEEKKHYLTRKYL